MINLKKSIKKTLIKYNLTIFIIIIIFLIIFFALTTIYWYKNNIKFYLNLIENLNFNFKNYFLEFINNYQTKIVINNSFISVPDNFYLIEKFLIQNLEKIDDIKIIIISNSNENNKNNFYKIYFKNTKKSISRNFIFFRKENIENKFLNKIKKDKFYFIYKTNLYFYSFLDNLNIFILEIPLNLFFNLQIIFIFLFIFFVILFLFLFYKFTIKYYRRFVNQIHKIYLYLNSLVNKDLNINIDKSSIEELDILIEKIKLLKNDIKNDNEYIINLISLIKKISIESSDIFIFYDEKFNIIFLNNSAKLFFNISNNLENNINFQCLFKSEYEKLISEIYSAKNIFDLNIEKNKFTCLTFKLKDINILMMKNESNFDNKNELIFLREFLSNFAHELRTPLNAIIGFSEIILEGIEGDIPEKLKEDIEAINNSSKTLLFYINQIIDFYSLNYKNENEEKSKINSSLIVSLLKSFFIKFIKNNKLNISFYDFINSEIEIDKFKIIAAFINIFSFILISLPDYKYHFYILKNENKPVFFISNELIEDIKILNDKLLNNKLPELENSIIKEKNENSILSFSKNLYYSYKILNLIKYNLYYYKSENTVYFFIF